MKVIQKVTNVEKTTSLSGSEIYNLTLACGHKVRQLARSVGKRHVAKVPTKKRCHDCETMNK
jgi:hypothetical protein